MNTDIPQTTPRSTPLPVLRRVRLQTVDNKSEVAFIMQQIDEGYEAAMRAMGSFASGTLRHNFINARMENMGKYIDELEQKFGEEATEQALIEWSEKVGSSTPKEVPSTNQ